MIDLGNIYAISHNYLFDIEKADNQRNSTIRYI